MNTFEQKYQESGFASQRKYPNESLVAFAAGLPRGAKVLDLGCGSGANTWFLAKEGFETYGIDHAPTGIELCKQMLDKWGVSADLKVGEMTVLPYPDNFFDAVVDIVSMQHLTLAQHEECIKEILRVLKPGGKFFSFHLDSTSDSFRGPKIDKYTIENIPDGYPLANNGQTCFLSVVEAQLLLFKFKEVGIEIIRRTYNERKMELEYLVIKATK